MSSPVPTAHLVEYMDALLDAPAFKDFGPNGLQVPGTEQVTRVVSGVSANVALLERAIDAGADLLLVHHGLIWDFQSRRLSRRAARRLRLALSADLNVVMYHLPLDAHATLGNNAVIADRLGLRELQPFGKVRGRDMGTIGSLPDPLSVEALTERVHRLTGRAPLVMPHGPAAVRRLAVLSGGGAAQLGQALAAGADAFLTGEGAEQTQAEAEEGGIHVLAGGHHATETFGVRALGEHLAGRFGIEHQFIEIPNPV